MDLRQGDPAFSAYAANHCKRWLWRYFAVLALLSLLALLVIIPYCAIWLRQSGDAGVERAVEAQASGRHVLFGSGLSQDFVDYKLQLYAATKPVIAAIGSSRVMQFRGAWFRQKFLNMGGVAGNLAVLRSTIDAMLAISQPQAVILGLDFWWFLPQWEKDPDARILPTSGSYNCGLASLKKPLEWLFAGKIGFSEFFAPFLGIFGKGFRADRFGIMAQRFSEGFGPDGAWTYTGEITGQKPAFDYQFRHTLEDARLGIRAFYHAAPGQAGPALTHLNVFAEIWCKLRSRGVKVFCFVPPLASQTLAAMDREKFPHLFKLREGLQKRGINVLDFSDARALNAVDCEFVDGFHGGEVAYARVLRAMADHWPALLPYVNMEKLDIMIRDWRGHAMTPDARITTLPETDFLGLGCQKRRPGSQGGLP